MACVRDALAVPPALFLVACASTSEAQPVETLPFHVSMLPVELVAAAPSEEGAARALQLELTGEGLRTALAEELGADCFVRISTPDLPAAGDGANLPEGFSGDPAGWNALVRSRFWTRDAAARRADLVAVPTLEYDPAVRSRTNGYFWLNLPLFLLGGPFCYWVEDRSYDLDARLRLRVYDAELLQAGRGHLGDRSAEVAEFQVAYGGTALNFVDRAGGAAGSYALSLLVPAGFLAKSTSEVHEVLSTHALEALAAGLEARLQEERERLLQPPGLNFFLQPGDLRARRGAGLAVEVEGVVRFRPDARVESLKGFSLVAGDASASFRFGEPRMVRRGPFSRTFVYDVRASLTPSSAVDSIQLRVSHGGGDDRARTFTLPLELPPNAVAGGPAGAP